MTNYIIYVLLTFTLVCNAQKNQIYVVSDGLVQFINTDSKLSELTGFYNGRNEIEQPSLVVRNGIGYNYSLKIGYLRGALIYSREDFEYTGEYVFPDQANDPAVSNIKEETIPKRQLVMEIGYGIPFKVKSPRFFFIESGVFYEAALNRPPILGPTSYEHSSFGLGSYVKLGYNYMSRRSYLSEGLRFNAYGIIAYNYESFNVPLDNLLVGLGVQIGYTW